MLSNVRFIAVVDTPVSFVNDSRRLWKDKPNTPARVLNRRANTPSRDSRERFFFCLKDEQ